MSQAPTNIIVGPVKKLKPGWTIGPEEDIKGAVFSPISSDDQLPKWTRRYLRKDWLDAYRRISEVSFEVIDIVAIERDGKVRKAEKPGYDNVWFLFVVETIGGREWFGYNGDNYVSIQIQKTRRNRQTEPCIDPMKSMHWLQLFKQQLDAKIAEYIKE